MGLSLLGPIISRAETKPLIIMEQAEGIVVSDPVKCVGCGRCELACTEFNDGKASPSLSRIKVDRNLNFGRKPLFDLRQGEGNWGEGLIVQDLCHQCSHPVPCADACPRDAIVIASPGNTRTIDSTKCNGCKICLKACPWEMISFDTDAKKATKCFLCNGKPKCVEACPAESLSYVRWRDLTTKIAPRISTSTSIPAAKAAACGDCHLPGARRSIGEGVPKILEAIRSGRAFPLRGFGLRWIDLSGTFLMSMAVLCLAAHGILRRILKR